MTNKLSITAMLVGLLFCQPSIAKQSDFANEVSIKAGKQQAQLKTNIGIFEKNVEIIHGKRKINADRLEVHRREELGDNKQLLVATGSPAQFSEQQSDGTKLTASAQEIRYDVANRTLVIKGNASINQAGQIIQAQSITYDMDKQLISAERGEQDNARVHTILVPEKQPKEAGQGN
ncbi:Lipopolysaccharide export system protein LptA [Pseudoalteromonas holothuriae]|uniref:Lipopolysaccharide export system protein LptA n=1 Tax=Pseudoalteromonas holothuriae TaxID=2963714 RepID=A0A9W4W686_9GAMM|nr:MULTISPECIES: lipopolysaccharide transport periplasmic protein LptA [unclassified Pseudoalteromonas]CAH9063309.1 Lipopolysaccharide export system protein LptA [Pseudoalteromonas sp. CIP111854]CAH9065050.1 Lipopolysaccharide export system protein LptA [Pseudoalteromonas sp. CIP111951]